MIWQRRTLTRDNNERVDPLEREWALPPEPRPEPKPVAPRTGLWRRIGRGIGDSFTGELRNNRAPNPLDFFLYGSSGIADMQQMNLLAAREARQAAEAEAERRMGKDQNQQLEAMIANEPPEIQAFARAFPQEYAQALARRSQDGGWESGQGYSHAFRVNPDGTVTRGDPLPLRPRAAVQGYVMPNDAQDWEYSDD